MRVRAPNVSLAIILAVTLPRVSAAAPAVAPPASQPALAPVNLSAVATLLASEDFLLRKKAQAMLDDVGPSRRKDLQEMADAAADPEVKAAFWQRLNAIDDDLALHPPPMHIAFDQLNCGQVGSMLRQQLAANVEFTAVQNRNSSNQLYSLPQTDAPFWDVIAALHDQHPLTPLRSDGDDRIVLRELLPGDSNVPLGFRNHLGGLVAFSTAIHPNGAPPNLQFSWQFSVATDPRMIVLRHTMPILKTITDDQGNIMLVNPNQNPPNWQFDQTHVWTAGVNFPSIPDHAAKVASASGTIQVTLLVREDHVDIDLQKRPENIVEVGGRRLQFVEINSQGYVQINQINWSPMDNTNQPMPLFVSYIDAAGQELLWRPFTGVSFSSSFPAGAHGKIRVTVPTRTREVAWSFELKDIPLPVK